MRGEERRTKTTRIWWEYDKENDFSSLRGSLNEEKKFDKVII